MRSAFFVTALLFVFNSVQAEAIEHQVARRSVGTSVAAQDGLSREKAVGGRTLPDLVAEWWQWAMSSSDDENPVMDTTGANCGVGQRGNVWFLAGGFGSSKIHRVCTIPAGHYLFFPIINMSFWPTSGVNDYSCEYAKRQVALNNNSISNLFAEIDGMPVGGVDRFRIATEKCFDIYAWVPASRKPYRAYPSASDGYWLLLPPLPKGRHTIKFGGKYNNSRSAYGRMVQDIEYDILVQ